MKTDARTRYTLKAIKVNFIELLKENPVNKVTVKELCDRAGINRATFYRYYEDIFDLYEKLKEEMVEEFIMTFDENQPRDIESDFVYFLGKIKENADSVCALSRQSDAYKVMRKMCKKNFSHFKEVFERMNPDAGEEESLITYYYISCGFTGIISEWIISGMKKDIEDVARIMKKLFINTIRSM